MKWQERIIVEKSRFFHLWNELNNFKYLVAALMGVRLIIYVPIWMLVLIGLSIIVLVWLLSIAYDKFGMIKYQLRFSNKRNEVLTKQYEEIKQIRKSLNRLEDKK